MSSNTFTITGNLAEPKQSMTSDGQKVLNLSVADTPSRFNQDTKEWEDTGEALWVRIALWGEHAEALAPLLSKGARVTATGRLVQRTWQDKDGVDRVSLELKGAVVGPLPDRKKGSAQGGGWGGQQQAPAQQRQQAAPAAQQPAQQQGWGGNGGAKGGDFDEPPF